MYVHVHVHLHVYMQSINHQLVAIIAERLIRGLVIVQYPTNHVHIHGCVLLQECN